MVCKLYKRENIIIKMFSYEAKKGDSWINRTINQIYGKSTRKRTKHEAWRRSIGSRNNQEQNVKIVRKRWSPFRCGRHLAGPAISIAKNG